MDTIKIPKAAAKMIAHRGLSGIEPENTCAAFVAAGNRSYYGIETDVHVTADGKFIVIHDDNTLRVSGYNKMVEQSTYDELRSIPLYGYDLYGSRSDLVLPDLLDYIRICKRYGKKAVLELKNHMRAEHIAGIVSKIRSEAYLGMTVFISFDWENLTALRSMLPQQEIQFLTQRYDGDLVEALAANRFAIDIYYRALSKERIEALHARGILVNCWTCDDKESAKALIAAGVDYLTTNILE